MFHANIRYFRMMKYTSVWPLTRPCIVMLITFSRVIWLYKRRNCRVVFEAGYRLCWRAIQFGCSSTELLNMTSSLFECVFHLFTYLSCNFGIVFCTFAHLHTHRQTTYVTYMYTHACTHVTCSYTLTHADTIQCAETHASTH